MPGKTKRFSTLASSYPKHPMAGGNSNNMVGGQPPLDVESKEKKNKKPPTKKNLPKYTDRADNMPTNPTLAGTSTHYVTGGQPGKRGQSKQMAKKNNKGKMSV